MPTEDSAVTVRLATSGDVEALAPLVEFTGTPLDEYLRTGLYEDGCAGALRVGLANGQQALREDIATAFSHTDGDPRPLLLRAALPLVAEHAEHGVVGTLLAYPPGHVLEQYYTAAARWGPRAQHKILLGGAITLIKLKAVAVAEHARGKHLGAALVQRCTRVYRQCGYALLYGQIDPGRQHLHRFYAHQGFTIHERDQPLDLWVLFGIDGGIHPDAGERLFAQWLS